MSISKIERGLLHPSKRTLQAIAEACAVSVEFFYKEKINIGNIDFRFAKNTILKISRGDKSSGYN